MATNAFIQAVRSQIAEAQKIAGGSGSEQDIAEAKIELEVNLTGLQIFHIKPDVLTNLLK